MNVTGGKSRWIFFDFERLSLVFLGISSVTTQLLTLREFLSQFHGNEITFSLSIFSWLLLSGLGTLLAKSISRPSLSLLSLLLLVAALMPLAQIAGIRLLRDAAFLHGTSQGFYQILFFIIAASGPYCLVSGFILPIIQSVSRRMDNPLESAALYLFDSIGDIVGGILFSFILVYVLHPFKAIAVTSAPLVFLSLAGLRRSGSTVKLFLSYTLAASFFLVSLWPGLEKKTLSGQHGEILRYIESPYGRVIISEEADQKTIWEAGVPLYSDRDLAGSAEKVHYILSQLDKVEDVLLVSGGLGETLNEVAKYNPRSIDYVELDPSLTEAAKQYNLLSGWARARIINADGRLYLSGTEKRYDAIIFDLPEPDSFQVNRFYTEEAMALVKKAMRDKGVFAFALDYSQNYQSRAERRKFSTLFSTTAGHFRNVLVLPGERAYFLCSDADLFDDIPERLKEKGIASEYIEGYFYGNATPERVRSLNQFSEREPSLNSDFSPGLMKTVFEQWFSRHGSSPVVFFAILAALALSYLIFIKKGEYVLFSTGFSIMGTEMLVLFSFQAVYGYLYLQMGAIVTAFLFGLLPGAIIGRSRMGRLNPGKRLLQSDFLVLLLLCVFWLWMAGSKLSPEPWIFLAYSVLFSAVCGFQFPAAAFFLGEEKSPLAGCLAADLWGAALGALVTGAFLIPWMGMERSVIALIIVKISSIIIITRKGGSRHG